MLIMVPLALLLTGVQAYTFFVITDIHLDVEYDPSYNSSSLCHHVGIEGKHFPIVPAPDVVEIGRSGCDSPVELLQSALLAMQNIDSAPAYILVTGDVVGHSTYKLLMDNGTYDTAFNAELVRETFTEVTNQFNNYFPSTQIIFAFGNNDGYGDYQLPNEPLDEYLYSLWEPLNPSLPEDFMENSYYTCTLTATGQRLLALSTNFFSVGVNNAESLAAAQLQWLESELSTAETTDQRVIVAMHIPPGPGMFGGESQDWRDDYIAQFQSILKAYSSTLDFVFAAHQHQAGFQLIDSTDLAIIIHSALSPVFRNNPTFRYYNIDNEGQDYTDYSLDLLSAGATWEKEIVFSEFTGLATFDYKSLYKELLSDEVMLFQYLVASRGLSRDVGVAFSDSYFWQSIMGLPTARELYRDALCSYRYPSNLSYYLCRMGLLPLS